MRLYSPDPELIYQARTDPEGRYSLEHIRPGTYQISASRASPAGGGDAFEAILDQQHSEVSINVVDGTTITRDLNLGS